MKSSLSTSVAVHVVLLTWGLWSLGAPEKLDMGSEAVPVELVTEVSQSMIGDEKAPQTDTPAPQPTKTESKLPMPAQNVGDNEVDLPTPPAPKAAPRESVKTTVDEAPPPPPPPAAKPPEPKPEPVKVPEPTPPPPEPEPETEEADSAPEIDPLAAEIAKAEAEKPPAPPRNVPAPQAKPKPPEPKPPEPVKVAEKKPEPVKEKPPEKPKTPDKSQATEASKEKPKDTKKPGKQSSDRDPLEDAVLAALKNTQDSAGGGAKKSTKTASLGGKTQTGGQLSQSEMDALRGQISKCWNPPAGNTDAGSFQVKISMQLDPSGAVQGMPQIEQGGGASPAQRAAAEAAIRAVRRCAPYNLPAEKYETWADVTVNFDPSQMF
ncbi:hypothetical protein ACP4J4_07940 [Aureimonas ureilytica]|uniref:hypothetical protein n=1 Tax=Aureimonas ureilytica TaxID=401562 RepID=UPI003CEE60CE